MKSKIYLQQEEELETILASIEESEKYGYDDAIEYDRVYAYYIHGCFDECRRIHKELEQTRPLSHSTEKVGKLIATMQSSRLARGVPHKRITSIWMPTIPTGSQSLFGRVLGRIE